MIPQVLVSLGHTDYVHQIIKNITVIITDEIKLELETIAKREDEDASSAQQWLNLISELSIKNMGKRPAAEDELFDICKKYRLLLVTDDVKAIKRFDDSVEMLFSVHIIYLLYKKDLISKENALLSIEKMRSKRDWKKNIIAITSQQLFE